MRLFTSTTLKSIIGMSLGKAVPKSLLFLSFTSTFVAPTENFPLFSAKSRNI